MATRDIENLSTPLYMGNGSDRVKVDTNGMQTFEGNATTWEDSPNILIGQRLESNLGTLDYDYDEAAISAAPNGDITSSADRAVLSFQISHSAKTDEALKLHVHWEQPDATERAFTYQYRVQGNGQEKTSAWSTAETVTSTDGNAFAYTSGTLNQITVLGDIPVSAMGLSAIVQIRFTRSDANTGNVLVTSVDCHYEKNSTGSDQEYVK